MQKFQNNIQDQFGNEITLPTITVRNVVGGGLSTIFSDDGVTSLANPFIAQDLSEFFFYAANNRYDIFITGPVTDSSLDVLLFDPIGVPATIPIDLADNEQIRFGDSQDTLMFFDGANFILQAVAGNLIFDGEVFATGSIYLTEKAAAGADTLTLGQFWVRNDAPNTPMFTDDLGNDFVLNAAVLPGSTVDSTLRFNGSTFIETDRVRISATGVLTVFDPTLAQQVTLLTSLTEAKLESTQDLVIKTADSFISFNIGANNVLTLQNNIVRVNTDSGGFLEIRDDIGNNVQLTTTSSSLVYQFSTNVKSIRYFDGISIFMEEKAAAESDLVGSGQFWVRNDAPNVAMFTDDVGTDFVLNAGGGGGNVTKVGTPVDNQIGVWTGDGTLEGDANFTWDGNKLVIAGAASQIRMQNGTPANPAYSWSADPTSGWHHVSSGFIVFAALGVNAWSMLGSAFGASTSGGPALRNEISSAINPTVLPNGTTASAGLGGIVNQPALIAGSLTCLSVAESGGARQLGLYATAPISLQTGVAVTAAGIHAALVNLGAFTA